MHNRSTKQRRAARRRGIAINYLKHSKENGLKLPNKDQYIKLISHIKNHEQHFCHQNLNVHADPPCHYYKSPDILYYE